MTDYLTGTWLCSGPGTDNLIAVRALLALPRPSWVVTVTETGLSGYSYCLRTGQPYGVIAHLKVTHTRHRCHGFRLGYGCVGLGHGCGRTLYIALIFRGSLGGPGGGGEGISLETLMGSF